MNSSLNCGRSSKFVDPVHSLSVACLFVAQPSSIEVPLVPCVGLMKDILRWVNLVTSGPSPVCCGMYKSVRGWTCTRFHMLPSLTQQSDVGWTSFGCGIGVAAVDVSQLASCMYVLSTVVVLMMLMSMLLLVLCDGIAGGCAAMLPGWTVPLFTLNHVSPVQVSPCRTLFCCDLLRSGFWISVCEVFVVAFLSVDRGPSVFFKSICWYGTPAVWCK